MIREELIQKCIDIGLADIVFLEKDMGDLELNEYYEASKYPKRRTDGQQYSDRMGAKMVLLDAPDIVKKEISLFFKQTQDFLCKGWWKSAEREIRDKQPNTYVSQSLLDNVRGYIVNYVNKSYSR